LLAALVCNSALNLHAQGKPISLPPQASEIAHGIYDLGTAVTAEGRVVQGIAFIHYAKDFVRPEAPGGGKPSKTSTCYSFLASGAKWKSVEPFVFDKDETDAATPLSYIETAISTWEIAAGLDILGFGSLGTVHPEQAGTYNGINEVMFGDIAGDGVIAMTTVWGIFGGRPAGRELIEWDMVFDTDWIWSYSVESVPDTMDFLNIATHEIGHAFGMGHPDNACTEETMYAYADYGEIKKRDLHDGDIAGIQKLYP